MFSNKLYNPKKSWIKKNMGQKSWGPNKLLVQKYFGLKIFEAKNKSWSKSLSN